VPAQSEICEALRDVLNGVLWESGITVVDRIVEYIQI
jgi:hypothetical protein